MKHSVPKLLRLSGKIVMAGLVMPFSALTKAEVTLDGTLGPAGSLAGPHFVIPDTVGQTVGTNLFHSFGLFNINTGESATFTGPSSIENVLGRVTGGSSSFIDGLLRTQFKNASPNLFLLNPAGVLFGPNASLDVQGSFHVSTADYLKLGDGGRFEATSPENSVLTVAPPEAFGFLGERQPAGIAVQGSRLQVPAGETLSVVGGDIQIADGSLCAPGGRIDMVSVASPGEVLPHAPDLGVASFERLGRIEVSHSSSERPLTAAGNVIANVDASGEGGGRIFIRGGEFVADNAFVFADTRGSEEGQGIDIGVTGQVTMRNGASITADTLGSGSGGDVTVEAGSLEVRNGAAITTSTYGSGDGGQLLVEADRVFLSRDGAPQFTGLASQAAPGSGGDTGDLTVRAGSLEVQGGAVVTTSTFSSGDGGQLLVEADRVLLSGDGATKVTGIASQAEAGSGGDAGDLTVRAGSLEVRNGAVISTTTFGSGDGGQLLVEADEVFLSHDPGATWFTGLASVAAPGSGGDAGDLTVRAGSLEVQGGAAVTTSTLGSGDGGQLLVEADRVLLSGDGATEVTGIASQAEASSSGDAGDLTVRAGSLEVRNGAVISTTTFSSGDGGQLLVEADRVLLSGDGATKVTSIASQAEAGSGGDAGDLTVRTGSLEVREGAQISASTRGIGKGGNVIVTAADITLRDRGTISARSTSADPDAGSSGSISVTATDALHLFNGSSISVQTERADAGDITLTIGNLLHLRDQSSITTSVAGGEGHGGNITLDSVFVVLDEGSSIIANAERGQGGNILIRILGGGALFQSPDSLIEASSEFGLEGSVVIDAPDTDIIAGFAGLPANFLDAATVLTQLCAGRSGANVSSLVVRKYEVLPDSPYALRVQLPRAMPTPRTAKQSRAPRTYYAGNPLPPMISCLGNG